MSSPHITGLGALIRVCTRWSPTEIKSAIMTTARRGCSVISTGSVTNNAFAVGAGQVSPKRFFDPGLFVTETGRNPLARVHRPGRASTTGVPARRGPTSSTSRRSPTAASRVPVTLKRSVPGHPRGHLDAVPFSVKGFTVTASPAKVVAKTRKNDVVDVKFTFTRTTARLDAYSQGLDHPGRPDPPSGCPSP